MIIANASAFVKLIVFIGSIVFLIKLAVSSPKWAARRLRKNT
jgi:hypothetical protein